MAREQVVRRQVAEAGETIARGPRVLLAVEVKDGLAQAEVARGPRVRPREVAGEEPVSGPLSDPGQRREGGLHLVVRKGGETDEVEIAPRNPDRVVGLPAREAERDDLHRLGERDALSGREGIGGPGLRAEGLDEAVADGKGRAQRDLLRGYGGDEGLVRVRRERRAEAAKLGNEARQHRLCLREGVEGVEVERPAEVVAHLACELRPPWSDPNAARRLVDPHLRPAEDTMDASLVPEVGEIVPEGPEPFCRE